MSATLLVTMKSPRAESVVSLGCGGFHPSKPRWTSGRRWIKLVFVKNKVVKFSSIIFTGNSVVNILSFLFTVLMARMLSPKGFGEMAVILNLTILIGIPIEILSNITTRYVALFKAKKNYSMIKKLMGKAICYSSIAGIFFLAIYYLFIPTLSRFLFIDDARLFIIIGFTFPLAFMSSIMSGVLFGLQKFVPVVLSAIIGVAVKLVLAMFLVFLGFSTMGPILAFTISSFAAFIFILWRIRLLNTKLKKIKNANNLVFPKIVSDIVSYAKTILFSTILLAIIASADIILVKHYFTPVTAGEYAALATAGKLILYTTSPVFTVIFPLLTEAGSDNRPESKSILNMSFIIILIISVFVLGIFIAAPNMVVRILFGQKYISISPYLFWFGIAIFFHAITRIFISFFMAVHEKTFIYPLAISTTLLIALIVLFHQSIHTVVVSLLITNIFLFAMCWLIYTKRMSKLPSSSR